MKEMPEFKVGDKVVALRRLDFEDDDDVLKGDHGVITNVQGDAEGTVEVQMDSGTLLDGKPGRDIALVIDDDRVQKRPTDDFGLCDFWANLEDKNPATAYTNFPSYTHEEMMSRSQDLYTMLNTRRSCRSYSSEKFPIEVLQNCIKAAGTAPSGANLQPWTYVIVQDPEVRKKLRALVEKHEEENYTHRLKEVWRNDIRAVDPSSTQVQGQPWQKPYVEQAAYVVCIFKQVYRVAEGGGRLPVYYPEQSVGISTGLFIAACHNAGLAALASYPMGAEPEIRDLLERPSNEKLCLLVPVGLPAVGCTILDHPRKELDRISVVI